MAVKQRDIDLANRLVVDGVTFLYFNSVSKTEGTPATWNATPVGGLPAMDVDDSGNSRTPIKLAFKVPLAGSSYADQQTFLGKIQVGKKLDCVLSGAISGQIQFPNAPQAIGRKFYITKADPTTDIADGTEEKRNLTEVDVEMVEIGATGSGGGSGSGSG